MERPSPAIQDYLKAIYRLAEDEGGDAPIATSAVAEALGVTAPSASNMLKRLDQLGYADLTRRQGVSLTDSGRAAALEVIRLHRLLETFLVDRLGMSWDEVHREAEVLEHHVSDALAARIAESLGHPDRDPHGDPIPTVAGDVEAVASHALLDLAVGTPARITRVDDRDDGLLRFLAERGLRPGAVVEVMARGEFGGPLQVRVDEGDTVAVPPDAARAVHVEDRARRGADAPQAGSSPR